MPCSTASEAAGRALVLPLSIVVVIAGSPSIGLGQIPHLAGADSRAAAGGRRARLDRPRGGGAGSACSRPLFALAWAAKGELGGKSAALALSALACVTLGGSWFRRAGPLGELGILRDGRGRRLPRLHRTPPGTDSVMNTAAPAADLPKLQLVSSGSALTGFGDLFIAAVSAPCSPVTADPAPRRDLRRHPLLRLGPPLLRDQDDPRDGPCRPDLLTLELIGRRSPRPASA